MIDRIINLQKFRRGTDAERLTKTYAEGEILFVTDKLRLYMGDGITLGGVLVSNKTFITTDTSETAVPTSAVYGDLVHKTNLNKTYIVNSDLTLRLLYDGDAYNILLNQLSALTNKFLSLTTTVAILTSTMLTACTGGNCPEVPPDVFEFNVTTFKFEPNPDSYPDASVGSTVTFNCSAVLETISQLGTTYEGLDNITYSWMSYNRGLLVGETSNTLILQNVQLSSQDTYTCIAINTQYGIAYSNPATLGVIPIGLETNFIWDNNNDYIITQEAIDNFILWE